MLHSTLVVETTPYSVTNASAPLNARAFDLEVRENCCLNADVRRVGRKSTRRLCAQLVVNIEEMSMAWEYRHVLLVFSFFSFNEFFILFHGDNLAVFCFSANLQDDFEF